MSFFNSTVYHQDTCVCCGGYVPEGRMACQQCEAEAETRKCRVCGCTWNHACPGGCYWVESDLCSACHERLSRINQVRNLLDELHTERLNYNEYSLLWGAIDYLEGLLEQTCKERDAALQGLIETDRWISVNERMPEEGETILVWFEDGACGMTVNIFDEMEEVTHWQPLPSPPISDEARGDINELLGKEE